MEYSFLNREKELDFLHRKFQSAQPELLIFRGRRRVGKTFLLKEFSEQVNGLYLLATVSSTQDQLQSFSKTISDHFGDRLLEMRPFSTWDELCLYLNQHVQKRTAIIIDEYPYLLESQPGLSTIIQKYWDEFYHTNPNIFLVLNGSALSMMEKETLDSKSPLYGRRSGQWFVAPFNVIENGAFFADASLTRTIEWYAISGGVPFYSKILCQYKTPLKAIENAILTYGEVLFEEVEFILRGEFRNPRSYFPVLKAIAQGSRKFGEISSKTGYDRSNLTKYISVLQNLQLIRREVPITEKNPAKSKKGLFYLNDYFMNFWFRYVFPNLQALETGEKETIFKQIVQPSFDQYVSLVCEPIIRQLLQIDYFNLNLHFERLGRYWDRQTEVDLLGFTSDNRTIMGEIKWTQSPVKNGEMEKLEKKIKRLRSLIRGEVQVVFISRSGFQERMKDKYPNVLCIDLREYQIR